MFKIIAECNRCNEEVSFNSISKFQLIENIQDLLDGDDPTSVMCDKCKDSESAYELIALGLKGTVKRFFLENHKKAKLTKVVAKDLKILIENDLEDIE